MNDPDAHIRSVAFSAMEALWDSLIRETPEIESPEWRRDILAGRKRKIGAGNAEFISVDELRSKHGR